MQNKIAKQTNKILKTTQTAQHICLNFLGIEISGKVNFFGARKSFFMGSFLPLTISDTSSVLLPSCLPTGTHDSQIGVLHCSQCRVHIF